MPKPSDQSFSESNIREKLIGLGEESVRKSYYPELQLQLEKLNERVEIAELIAEISKGLTEEGELRRSLQRCSDVLLQRTNSCFVRIWVYNKKDDVLELQASSGLHTNIDGKHSKLSVKDYPYKIGIIARSKTPLFTTEVDNTLYFHNSEWVKENKILSFAGYPLVLQNRLVGVIALFSKGVHSEEIIKTISAISNQVAVGIERIQALVAFKESEERFRLAFETNPEPVIIAKLSDGAIVDVNKAFEESTGIKRIDALGKNSEELNVWEKEGMRETFRTILKEHGEIKNLEANFRVSSEHVVTGLLSATLFNVSDEPHMLLVIRDVSKLKEAEQTLIEMDKIKNEFISTAAHELRTPLTAILGYAEFLKEPDEYGGFNEAQKTSFACEIYDRGESLSKIIDDMLDVSRIESGDPITLNFEEVEPGYVLNRVYDFYSKKDLDHKYILFLPEDVGSLKLYVDRHRMIQVVENLISNAQKYSGKGTEIHLKGEIVGNKWKITISDFGLGMSLEESSQIFNKFYRADSSNTAVSGLGIGMSIVKQIVEEHGGEISVKSKKGEGTEINFCLQLI